MLEAGRKAPVGHQTGHGSVPHGLHGHAIVENRQEKQRVNVADRHVSDGLTAAVTTVFTA